jgi:hypothetical protein
MKKSFYLLIFFFVFFSCKKKESCFCLDGPDTSGDRYLYFYIDDCLYEVDASKARFGSGSGSPPFSITVDGENAPDTLRKYEAWEHLEHELTVYGSGRLPEAEDTGFNFVISLENVNLNQNFDLQSGHCPYYYGGSGYNDPEKTFAFLYTFQNEYCSDSTSGKVKILEYRYDSLGLSVEGTFDFTLYNKDNLDQSFRLIGAFKNQY